MKQSYIHQIKKKRKLTIPDIVTLLIFLSIKLFKIIIDYSSVENVNGLQASSSFITAFTSFYLINTTSFANRFINLNFSIPWLILSLVLIVFGKINLIGFNMVPLLELLFYQLIRFLFWKNYRQEFIPCYMDRNKPRDFYNKFEHRAANPDDKRYMKKMLWIGFVILFACLLCSVGRDL